jgi:hypothetical protein
LKHTCLSFGGYGRRYITRSGRSGHCRVGFWILRAGFLKSTKATVLDGGGAKHSWSSVVGVLRDV